MSIGSWIIISVGVLAWAWFCRWVLDTPRPGDALTGMYIRFSRMYACLVHRLRVKGREHMPRTREAGPLIVVCNHTAGVDPVLVQSVVPFEIRWMMARDMRLKFVEPIWRWSGAISINRGSTGGGWAPAMKDAIRYVRDGGVLGIFPEGRIERPARRLLPFMSGVGLLIARTGAKVLPVVIEGTPQTRAAWGSLWRRSHSTITFLPPVDYVALGMEAGEIAEDLRRRYSAHTGWKVVDDALKQTPMPA